MKPKIAELWIEALNSGVYKQGKQCLLHRELNGDEFYCCLGVLSDLYVKSHLGSDLKPIEYDFKLNRIYGMAYFGEERAFLPKEVIKWAGMSSKKGSYNGTKRSLTNDNDGDERKIKPKTFKQIARVIRSKQEEL